MKLRDAEPGQRVVVVEKMPGNQIRHTIYERRSDDIPVKHDFDVPIARVRMTQWKEDGTVRHDSGEIYCTDPGEALGDIVVVPYEEGMEPF